MHSRSAPSELVAASLHKCALHVSGPQTTQNAKTASKSEYAAGRVLTGVGQTPGADCLVGDWGARSGFAHQSCCHADGHQVTTGTGTQSQRSEHGQGRRRGRAGRTRSTCAAPCARAAVIADWAPVVANEVDATHPRPTPATPATPANLLNKTQLFFYSSLQ